MTTQTKSYDEIGNIIAFKCGELEDEQVYELFQHLIDSGLVWQLQGFYGRTARALIEQGYCHSKVSKEFTELVAIADTLKVKE